MDTTFDSQVTPARRQRLVLLLFLAAAGIAGNIFRLPIFFNIEFLLGSVFSLYALQVLGLGRGVLVAALASSVTYFIWNHPYAIVIMTLEVLVVGILSRKGKIELVLADGIFWLVLGMPLVYLFYGLVMDLPPGNVSITMLKQTLNGVANALLARLLFLATRPRVQRRLPTLREYVFNLLVLFTLAPALTLLILQSRTDFNETDNSVREAMRFSARRVSTNLDRWLNHRAIEVERLARIAASRPLEEVQRDIEDAVEVGRDFLRIGFVDQDGRSAAFSPLVDELGQSNLGRSFAGRPYIPMLKDHLQPMFSEVVMGRVGIPAPIVTALAPVVVNGKYAGYVAGVLRLDGLEELVALNALSQTLKEPRFSLVDRNGKVIVTNRPDVKLMSTLSREAGELVDRGNGVSQWIPLSRRNIAISERWKSSIYITENEIGPMSEWKLVLEQEVAPYQAAIFTEYSGALAIALAILAAALPLAEWLSRRVSRSLQRLELTTSDIPRRIDSGLPVEWPQSNLRETEHLVENFKGVTDALSEQFGEIRRVNAELVQALDEVKTLQGILPICSYCKNIRNDAGAWEQLEAYVSRHSGAQFSHGLCPDCLAAHFPGFSDPPGDGE